MSGQILERLSGPPPGHERDPGRQDKEGAGNAASKPRRLEIAKKDMECDRQPDRPKSGAKGSEKCSFRCLSRAVLGKISSLL